MLVMVMLSFMDSFSSYNQIEIKPTDQYKNTFIYLWGTFTYCKLPFGLKNVGATFQRAISYVFHNIKHIIEVYHDELTTRYFLHEDHHAHLRDVFL